jgi:hypothetical protein
MKSKNIFLERISQEIGYIFGYFLFTTALFLILNFLNKIPPTWTYFHVMGLTLLMVFIGTLLKKLLK